MNLKTIGTNAATACITATICCVLVHSPAKLARSPQTEPSVPAPQRVMNHEPVQAKTRTITWEDIDAVASLQEWVAGLKQFGMDSDYIRALVQVKQRRLLAAKPRQPYHERTADGGFRADQRRAQLEVDEMLAQLDPAPDAAVSQLGFLDPGRRQEILDTLKSFERDMRALEHKNADGIWESEDWNDLESLKQQRQEALLRQFTPDEKRQWIVQESPEADELRARYIELSKDKFDDVAQAKYEANQSLAQNLSDEDRNRIKSLLDGKLTEILGKEGFQQLKRAEDPFYEAYWSLGEKLGLDTKSVNCVFDWQNFVQRADVALRQQGLSAQEIEKRMKPVVDKAKSALEQVLGTDSFRRFSEMPQGLFLAAYAPLHGGN